MLKNYFLLFCIVLLFSACSQEESGYVTLDAAKNGGSVSSPVKFDLTQVPFPKLSDYHFFVGELKNQTPAYAVLPYQPASSLFSDYAHKKRFVWLPKNTKASFNGAENVLEFPVGAVLIKTFYYDNVQPDNTTSTQAAAGFSDC